MNAFAKFTLFLFLSSEGMSNLFCEDTIHINSDNSKTEIMLHCNLGVKYSFCQIGKLSPTKTDESCTFYIPAQSSWPDQTFVRHKCDSETLIESIEYKGIVQSDFDCKFRIKDIDDIGKERFIILPKI